MLGFGVESLFLNAVLSVLSSMTFISLRKSELVALLNSCSCCPVGAGVLCLFLVVLRFGVWSVVVVYLGHTHLRFMRGSRKFCQRGLNLIKKNFHFFSIFLIDEGIEDPNTTLNELSSVFQRNAVKMAFRWRADDGLTLNAGLVQNVAL